MILRFIERNVLKQINSMKSPRVFGTLHAKCLSNAHAGLSSGSNLVLDEDKVRKKERIFLPTTSVLNVSFNLTPNGKYVYFCI